MFYFLNVEIYVKFLVYKNTNLLYYNVVHSLITSLDNA